MTPLLTLREAADILRISTHNLRKIKASELPRYRVGAHGGSLKYRAEDLEAYVQSRREGDVPKASPRRLGRMDGKPFQHL